MIDRIVTAYMNAFDMVFGMIFNVNPLSQSGGQIMIGILIICSIVYIVTEALLTMVYKKDESE